MTRALPFLAVGLVLGVATQATAQGKMQSYNGLEMTPASVERAPTASLKDCPPGSNTVTATTRPGAEFAIVTVKFKVTPAFKPAPIKRPVLMDASGKAFNTAVQFVDVASVPEFSCSIPFRVPAGTAVKALQVETATLDLTGLEMKKP
ncbi:MAG: hypothetical protein HY047_00520 [Acidobacteria bacterium]|nr:hypothetical protein [Acidobacteriota bacterium]